MLEYIWVQLSAVNWTHDLVFLCKVSTSTSTMGFYLSNDIVFLRWAGSTCILIAGLVAISISLCALRKHIHHAFSRILSVVVASWISLNWHAAELGQVLKMKNQYNTLDSSARSSFKIPSLPKTDFFKWPRPGHYRTTSSNHDDLFDQ